MDDYSQIANRRKAYLQQQAAAEQLRIKQEQANAIKNQPTGLAAVLNGIGEKIGDFGSTLNNIGKTIFGGFSQGQSEAKTKQIRADDSARRNEIAKKYGYNSYSDAMNDENASQDFWNEIKSSNQKTKDELAQKRESENNSYGNVKNIDLNKAKGQALNTIGTVLDVAPGFGVVGNALSGVVEGAGDAYKAAEGGTDADVWGNGNLNTTLGRMAAGGTSALVGGKVAKSLGPAKTVLGNVGKAAVSGAASGATSGGIMGLATGQDVLQSALQGGLQGAEGGAVMGGVNAVTAKGLNALSNRKRNKTTIAEEPKQTTLTDAEKMDIQDTISDLKKQRNNAAVRKDFGFQDVQARRENYAKSLPDAYGELQAQGLKNRKDMISVNNRLNNSESGTFQKARRNILANSGDIDLKSGNLGLDDASLQRIAQDAMLSGKDAQKAISDVNSLLKSRIASDDLASQMNGRTAAIDASDILKKLEQASVDARKAQGSSSIETRKSKFYDNVAKTLSDAIDETSQDTFNAFRNNPDSVNSLFSAVEKQHPEYANYLRQELANANSLSDMRSLMQNLTIISKANDNAIANNSSAPSVNAQTFMGNLQDRNMRNIPTSPVGAAKNAIGALTDTVMGDKDTRQIKALDKQIAKYEKILGDNTKSNTTGITAEAVNAAKEINSLNPEGNVAKYIAGQGELESPVGRGLLGKAADATMDAAEKATILDAINPNATARIAAFNDRLTQPTGGAGINALGNIENRMIAESIANNTANRPAMEAAQNELAQAQANANAADLAYSQAANTVATAQNNGQLQLQRISAAMDAALAAGDITSYGKLADLYQQAYKIYGQTEKEKPKALTTTQSKALSGLQQLEALESMTPDAGTALANSPLGFLVNLTGGNEYANQAQALALTLGYLQSGANITPREAENIGKSYVPTAYDSEQVRQQKLARARQLLQNYLADTTSLTQ